MVFSIMLCMSLFDDLVLFWILFVCLAFSGQIARHHSNLLLPLAPLCAHSVLLGKTLKLSDLGSQHLKNVGPNFFLIGPHWGLNGRELWACT